MELHVDIFNKKENHLIVAFNLTKHFCKLWLTLGEVVNFHHITVGIVVVAVLIMCASVTVDICQKCK
jgi:hypothetical protein